MDFKQSEKLYFDLIDKEKNIYELASLYPQNRKEIKEYIDLLVDPITHEPLNFSDNKITSNNNSYPVKDNVADFNTENKSKEWEKLNKQFLNYHKSLSAYTLINNSALNNYVSLNSGIGLRKNIKVLDVGGGTGHAYCSFFQYPETIEYYLVDPNLRLLHDQFLRIYPKLSFLKMAHILAQAEFLPIKSESFDLVLSISAIDHLNDYSKFISEAYRVLKPGGTFFITSHLDIPASSEDSTSTSSKLFSDTFWERVSRYLYYKKHKVGSDDHTLHLTDLKPIEKELLKHDFVIEKQSIFKRYFYVVATKK